MTQRIAIFGDVHGNSAATTRTLEAIAAAAPDAIYCLGTSSATAPGPTRRSTSSGPARSRRSSASMTMIVGFDRDDCGCAYTDAGERARGQESLMWTRSVVDPDRKAYLRGLLPEIRLDIEGVRVRLVHGSPRRMNEYLFADRDERSLERIAAGADCDVLVFGHTHIPWSRTIGDVLFVNAGSAGKPKDGDPRACWVLLTLTAGQAPVVSYHRVPYDIAAMATAIRRTGGLPDRFAEDLETAGVLHG